MGWCSVEPVDELVEDAVEALSFGRAELAEEFVLGGDEILDGPSAMACPFGVSSTRDPRRSSGSGRRTMSPAASSRFRRLVIPAGEIIATRARVVGVKTVPAPPRRSAARTSNSPTVIPCGAKRTSAPRTAAFMSWLIRKVVPMAARSRSGRSLLPARDRVVEEFAQRHGRHDTST